MEKKKVIIVGGGCAGLSAAYNLNKAGWDVEVVESQKGTGGRMQIFKENGFLIDEYAQFVHPSYKYAKELMTELDLIQDLQPFDLGGGMSVWFNNHWVAAFPDPEDAEAVVANKEWIEYMGEDNFGRFCQYVESYCAGKFYEGSTDWMMDADEDDGSNFAEFVKENFGERLLEYYVQPVVASLGLEHPELCGVAFGLQIVWTVMVGGAAVLKGGLGRLGQVITDILGDKIHTGDPATEIVIEDGKAKGVKTVSGKYYEADYVVSCVPGAVALKLMPNLPEDWRKAVERVTYCRTIHATLFFDKKLTDGKKPVGGLLPRTLGHPFCTILFQSSRNPVALPDDDSDAVSVFYFGEDKLPEFWDMSEEEILADMYERLCNYYDLPDHYVGGHVIKAPLANYTMRNGVPTEIKRLRDTNYKEVEGLYLGGEYMYTGSYESALNCGRNIARCIMGEIESI